MGAVVSCLQGIGACIMRVIEVIAGVITSIVYGVVDILKAIVAFLTCKLRPLLLLQRTSFTQGRRDCANVNVQNRRLLLQTGRRHYNGNYHQEKPWVQKE